MSEDQEVRDALHRIAPRIEAPGDLLANARRRRARRRTGVLVGAGLATVVLAVALAPQLPLFPAGIGGIGGATSDTQEEAVYDSAVSDGAGESLHGAEAAAEAGQRLAWEVIGNTEAANRVVSPSSLALSLAMAAEGARGDSLASIDEALGLTGDERAEAFGALRRSLISSEADLAGLDLDDPPAVPLIHQANRVVTVDATADPAFLERLGTFFDTPLLETTYPAAQDQLDVWVRENTAGLIEKSGIVVTPDTRVVVQDALLFAAAWRTWFAEEVPLPFDGSSGTRDVEMVRGVVEARAAEGERWTAVRLPYDEALAADIVLPREGVAPEDLTAEELAEAGRALDAAPAEEIEVTMPAFDLTAQTDLLTALPEIDLTDLGGIVPGGAVEQWVQQARLRMNARGTVAAAVTEIAVAGSGRIGPEPHAFVVDRPYAIRVLDTRSGWALFLATVSDPSA
ncbi:MAG TPA: serpin family protein [Arachnia sp.]|nr:serpin family protein [Arachnia sp.]HMT85709.1 serpin family protein [Arachnia sp.]